MNESPSSYRYSFAIRSWHWLTFLVTCFMLFTIAVTKTFLDGRHISFVVDHATAKLGVKLTPEQIRETVSSLLETVWKWHIRAGYLFAGLFGLRIVIEVAERKSIKELKNAIAFLRTGTEKKNARHDFIVKLIYLVFYGLMAVLTFTGLWMAWYRNDKSITREQFHDMKEIHETCFNLTLVFIAFHLAGVIRGELGRHKNIVSGMIHGNKETTTENPG